MKNILFISVGVGLVFWLISFKCDVDLQTNTYSKKFANGCLSKISLILYDDGSFSYKQETEDSFKYHKNFPCYPELVKGNWIERNGIYYLNGNLNRDSLVLKIKEEYDSSIEGILIILKTHLDIASSGVFRINGEEKYCISTYCSKGQKSCLSSENFLPYSFSFSPENSQVGICNYDLEDGVKTLQLYYQKLTSVPYKVKNNKSNIFEVWAEMPYYPDLSDYYSDTQVEWLLKGDTIFPKHTNPEATGLVLEK